MKLTRESSQKLKDSEPMKSIRTLKNMMVISGTWPAKSPKFYYIIFCLTALLFLAGFLVTSITTAFANLKDIETVSYGLSCASSASQSFFRQIALFLKMPNFHRIFQHLNQPLFRSHDKSLDGFIIKKMKMCNKLRNLLVGSSMLTVTLLAATPIVNNKLGRTLPVPFPLDMNEQPLIFYIIIWCYQVVTAAIITWGLPCLDSFIFTCMWIAVAQLQILKEKIIHAVHLIKDKEANDLEDNDEIIEILKKCVAHHVAIERYVASLEDTFSSAFLIQLLASLVITCFIGFTLVVLPINSVQFGRCFFFFLAVMMELALFCLAGNELIIQSEKIRDACYMMEWNSCSLKVRKILMLMMERSKRPFILTVGKFATLNLETLLTVWKTAFSYFTVLWRLYSDLKYNNK